VTEKYIEKYRPGEFVAWGPSEHALRQREELMTIEREDEVAKGEAYADHIEWVAAKVPGTASAIRNRGRKAELDGQSGLPRFSPYAIPARVGTVECPYCPRKVMPQGLEDHIAAKHPERAEPKTAASGRSADMEPNWGGECMVCGASPTVPLTGMCGPCSFGKSDTMDGNW
jgi:hypothetical protein